MEKEKPKTAKEIRKEEFDEQAKKARDLGDTALHDIDDVLRGSALFREWLGEPEP